MALRETDYSAAGSERKVFGETLGAKNRGAALRNRLRGLSSGHEHHRAITHNNLPIVWWPSEVEVFKGRRAFATYGASTRSWFSCPGWPEIAVVALIASELGWAQLASGPSKPLRRLGAPPGRAPPSIRCRTVRGLFARQERGAGGWGSALEV